MLNVKLDEAQERLPELIDEAASGGDVVISRGDGASFRLVPVVEPHTEPVPEPRRGGGARGLIKIGADFDDPIPGFEPYT